MQEIQYLGEHLVIGKIGHLAVITGFVFSFLAAFAYFKQVNNKDQSWHKLARFSFSLHSIMVFLVMALLFVIMINRYYEFNYAFKNVNDDLPFRYIFSAFWADQELSLIHI